MKRLLFVIFIVSVSFAQITRSKTVNWITDSLNIAKARVAGNLNVDSTISADSLKTTGGISVTGPALVSGNVGIGTTSPLSLLHLNSNSPFVYLDDASTSGTLKRFRIIPGDVGTTQTVNFGFSNSDAGSTGPIDVLSINESGNVGIGTTSPAAKLDVVGGIKADSIQASNNIGTPTLKIITVDGYCGIAVYDTAGETISKGNIVMYSQSANSRLIKATFAVEMPCAISAQDLTSGQVGWFIIGGYAWVKFASGETPTRGYVAAVSSTAGEAANASSIAGITHNNEIGHVVKTGSLGGLGLVQLHWN